MLISLESLRFSIAHVAPGIYKRRVHRGSKDRELVMTENDETKNEQRRNGT